MSCIQYISKKFKSESLQLINQAESVIEEYSAQGYSLTLRQLYYQFVARDIIANTERSYKNLGTLINNARLAGMLDWEAIVDRTRNVQSNPHWDSPADIVSACESAFAVDKWATQEVRVEVWIEKDALVGVIERVCGELDVPYFACRGYNSQSEAWRAGQRFIEHACDNQETLVLHLGDHDPSGIDMTRDNYDRLRMFTREYGDVGVKRLALNYDQIEQYDPPPNPTKLTDSRAASYVNEYGYSSWELDALEPSVIEDLIRDAVMDVMDEELWDIEVAREHEGRAAIRELRQKL